MVCFGRKRKSGRSLSSCRQLANRLTYLVIIAPIDATASVSVAEQSQRFALSNLPLLRLYSLIREDREAEETSVLDSHYLLLLDYLAHYLL
jgi:hypothetical protein